MKKNNRLLTLVAIGLLTFSCGVCSSCEEKKADPDINDTVKKTMVIEGNSSIKVSETTQLIVKENGIALSGVTFSLSDNTIVSITSDGLVTGAKVGNVSIIAIKDGYNNANINIEVKENKVEEETPTPTPAELKKSEIEFLDISADGEPYPPSVPNLKVKGHSVIDIITENLFGSNNGEGVRFSSGRNSGSLTLKFTSIKIKNVVLIGKIYGTDEAKTTVNLGSVSIQKSFSDGSNEFAFEKEVITNSLTIKSPASNRFYLSKIVINSDGIIGGGGENPDPDPTPTEKTGTINLVAPVNGKLTADKKEGKVDELVTLTVIPNEGYILSSITVNGIKPTKVDETTYTFNIIEGINTVYVSFKDLNAVDGNYSNLYANNVIKPNRGDSKDVDETYYAPIKGLSGVALKEGLHKIIKGHTPISKSSLAPAMHVVDIDPFNNKNLIITYEGSLPSNTPFNKEHTWAKSHGNFEYTPPCGVDLHHLRPCDTGLNSWRSNYDFKAIPHTSSYMPNDKKFYRSTMDGNYCDPGVGFEPKDEFKGDVARMLFYMAVRYEGTNGELDLEVNGTIPNGFYDFTSGANGVHGNFIDMYNWCTSGVDPVSDFEVNRNNLTDSKYQHNRNPFIDHPEFLKMIYDKSYSGNGALLDK